MISLVNGEPLGSERVKSVRVEERGGGLNKAIWGSVNNLFVWQVCRHAPLLESQSSGENDF